MIKKEGKIKGGAYLILSVVLLLSLSAPMSAYSLSITKENVINLTNQARIENGSAPLVENSKLTQAAQAKAEDMIAKDYWAHYYKDEKPWDWMQRAGYQYTEAGENLAIDFKDAENMQEAWMNSDTHRRNLLNSRYKEIGIGIAEGWFKDHNTIIVVQMFGRPKESRVKADYKNESNLNSSNKKMEDKNKEEKNTETIKRNLSEKEISQLDTNAKVGKKETGFAQTILGALNWVGETSLALWNSIKSAGHSSIAWVGSLVIPNYSVSAD